MRLKTIAMVMALVCLVLAIFFFIAGQNDTAIFLAVFAVFNQNTANSD